MLRLSESKLQYLRDKGLIPFKKLGGITYYNSEEIEKLMASGKLNDRMHLAWNARSNESLSVRHKQSEKQAEM